MKDRIEKGEAIEAAAKWWADRLRASQKIDIGRARPETYWLLGLMRAKTPPLDEEQITRFQAYLEDVLAKELADAPWDNDTPIRGQGRRIVDTGYRPGFMLSEAGKRAGIEQQLAGLLPPKTIMWIDPDGVKVALGYGAKPERIV